MVEELLNYIEVLELDLIHSTSGHERDSILNEIETAEREIDGLMEQ